MVGIVIVSHSPKVAEGAADMVRQMVGDACGLAYTSGDPSGALGTSVEAILASDRSRLVECRRRHPGRSWRRRDQQRDGDRDAAEARRERVVVCNAPIVEGSVIAATEASGGSPLSQVKRAAEELNGA